MNIPADVTELPSDAGNRNAPKLPKGALQTRTDFGAPGYGGPCPPSGTHRYFFKIYALDTELKPDSKTTKDQLSQAMKDIRTSIWDYF